MPLPWKKGGRISQLVADHLHSPKRGGSLVVETGFPTSLIDLFVKNRDRLKKKRYKAAHHPDLILTTPLPSSSQTTSPIRDVSVSDSPNPYLNLSSGNEIVNKSDFVDGNKLVEVVGDGNGILMSVMKMSLVVILAFFTKKFTVGITVSALLLIFLDYLGKHVCKPLGSLIQLVLGFPSIIKQVKLVTKEENFRDFKSPVTVRQVDSVSTEGTELIIPNQEIQILQPIEGIQCVKLEDRFGCGVIEIKARRSRSAKLKSNIKKLVPKKLRSSKKKKRKDLENEETSSSGQGAVMKCEEQKTDADWESLSLFSSGKYAELGVDEDDEEQVLARTEVVENVIPTAMEGLAVERERNSETQRNCGYLIFVLIVLVGLVGGRVFALLLTLLWCLMIKSAGKLRYVKVPVVWFPVKSF